MDPADLVAIADAGADFHIASTCWWLKGKTRQAKYDELFDLIYSALIVLAERLQPSRRRWPQPSDN
jgi:hypothetical protein